MALPDSFDPHDPRLRLPDPADPASLPKVPPPVGRPTRGVGWGNIVLTTVGVVGMLVCCPVFLKIRAMDADEVFTPAILLPVLGFLFSLIIFAGTLGVRFVYWFADWFVDFIFSTHGGGTAGQPIDTTWELPRMPKPPQEPDRPEPPSPQRGPF